MFQLKTDCITRAAVAALLCTVFLCVAQDIKKLERADELSIYSESGEYDLNENEIHLKSGRNRIVYGPVEMTADEMWFNQKTMDFKALRDVVIKLEDGTSWATSDVRGNLSTRQLSFKEYGFDGKVWHSGGERGENTPDGYKTLENAWLSTCCEYPPHYRLCASSIHHNPDNTFTAWNIVLKLGGVPVFYFPFVWGTTDNTSGMIVKPGFSGKRGAYLQLGRIWRLDGEGEEEDNYTRTYTDLMSKRGVGLGHDTELLLPSQQLGVKLYGLFDSDPPETSRGYNRRFEEEHDRYRLNLYYAYELTDDSKLRLNIDYLSDIDMLEDWYKRDYRKVSQPKSYLSLNKDTGVYSASFVFRPRLNDFYTVVETLPELRLQLHRQALGPSPLQYQGSNSLGYYSMKWRNFARKRWELIPEDVYDGELHRDPSDYSTFRADTMHFLYLPMEFADILDFIPRAGFRATYYSDSSRNKISSRDLADMFVVDDSDHVYNRSAVRHYDSDGGEVFRLAYELGAELKTRLYSDWNEWHPPFMDSEAVRHVMLPYINYTFSPDPSHDREHIYFFDETDRLERQHFIRLGLDHHFQALDANAVRTFARWRNYVDIHFDRGDESDRHPGDFGTRADLYPVDWLDVWFGTLHDVGEGNLQRGEFGFRFGEEEKLNMSLKYVYRNDHFSRSVYSMGSTLVDISGESSYYKKYFESADIISGEFFIPINSKTSFEIEAEYDFDKDTLSEHKYIVNRQLHCWIVSFGVGWDNGDFEAMVMLRLTAFPKVKIDLNL